MTHHYVFAFGIMEPQKFYSNDTEIRKESGKGSLALGAFYLPESKKYIGLESLGTNLNFH